MYIVSEAVCQQVFSRTDAFGAVESVFAAMASGEAYNFPVIRENIGFQTRSTLSPGRYVPPRWTATSAGF